MSRRKILLVNVIFMEGLVIFKKCKKVFGYFGNCEWSITFKAINKQHEESQNFG